MIDGVTGQEHAAPEQQESQKPASDKEFNFRRLEAEREREREARIRAEMEREALLKEVQAIKDSLKPKESDPLDELNDLDDADQIKSKLRQTLERERRNSERRAEEIAHKTYETRKKQDDNENFIPKLRNEYRDYDDVMSEGALVNLEKSDPVFLKAVLQIPDNYERRKLTYEYLKSRKTAVDVPSIKEKVEANAKNSYYIPSGSGTPSAVDFDVRSKQARESAYAKLKAAQRR